MIRFLHCADIHLDSPLQRLAQHEGAPAALARGASRRAFENLVTLALATPVDFVLIAGDLFDGQWRDYNSALFLVGQLRRMREAGIPVILISGNHDAASPITCKLRLPEGVHLLPLDAPGTLRLPGLNVAIHGQGFAARAEFRNLALSYPPPVPGLLNIGMLHTSLTGREGHEPYAPCTPADLIARGYDYWALGHVHQRETICERPWIGYPGNLQGRHANETGPKGALLACVDERGDIATQFRPLADLSWERLRLDCSAAHTGYDVLDLLLAQLQQMVTAQPELSRVVRVELAGTSPAHAALAGDPERWDHEIRAAAIDCGGGRLWVEQVRLLLRAPTRAPATLEGPLGEVRRRLDELRQERSALLEIGCCLRELLRVLPPELRPPGDPALQDPHWLAGLLEEVEPLVLCRLTQPADDAPPSGISR
jgi:DNA repair exonuclease SbcCD nuclease subunit